MHRDGRRIAQGSRRTARGTGASLSTHLRVRVKSRELVKMSLDEKLDQLAERDDDPEATIARERGQDAEAFHATVSRVRRYAQQGYLIIVREKNESRTGEGNVVGLRVRLTPAG